MEILRAEHLVKIFYSRQRVIRALDDVSFSIESGEFVSIVGDSGSGKSTLIHILGTIDRPTSGKLFLREQDVFAQKPEQLARFRRREVGIVFQFNNLLPSLSVEENIKLPALLDSMQIDEDYYKSLIEILGLQGREHDLPGMLSGGQQERVSIGRALINSPSIILADEPTGNLDTRKTREIIKLLRMLNRDYEQTILLITHDKDIALHTDRMLTIDNGRKTDDIPIRFNGGKYEDTV